jgi:hypothetical protein
MTARKDELRQRLTAALSEVTLAEGALETTLRELGNGGPRAEKVAVTAIVTEAFARLRRAHEDLNRVRDLIEVDDE